MLLLNTTIIFAQNITLKELVSFKTKSISSTQLILKAKNYSYHTSINGGTQWKANDGSSIIGSNGKGVVLLMTSNIQLHKSIINEMKKSSFKYTGKTTKNNLAVDSYTRGNDTIMISEIKDPAGGKTFYSITII